MKLPLTAKTLQSIVLFMAMGAWAQANVVTNNSDSDPGSLRAVIASAAPGSTITFAPALSGATILLQTGQINIDKSLTIDASALASRVAISGDADEDNEPTDLDSRIFEISATSTVVLKSLILKQGKAPNGLTDMQGGHGGGILNHGNLTVMNSSFEDNVAGTGGASTGRGGFGGGIYNAGVLSLEGCTFTGNSGGQGAPPSANGGHGGGIYNAGTLTVQSCTLNSNRAGQSGLGLSDTGGSGGGIYNGPASSMLVLSSTISNNQAGDGGSGGNGGNGGGIFNRGSATVHRCLIDTNRAGVGGLGDGLGNGGSGGGLYNDGTMWLMQTTLTANLAGGGLGDDGGNGGNGGGVYNRVNIQILNCTITNNQAGSGLGLGKGGSGGGIYQEEGTADMSISNTIVAGNQIGSVSGSTQAGTGPDVRKEAGALTRTGVNFIGNNAGATAEFPSPAIAGQPNSNGDLVGTAAAPRNPMLRPLANNGGPTRNLLPLAGSPVIDPPGGDTSSTFPTDQRELPRVLDGDSMGGAVVDIGAVEFDPVVDPSAGVLSFEKEPISVMEEVGVAMIPIRRIGGALGKVSVRVDSTVGTATHADYVRVNNLVLTYEHGELVKHVPVTIIADLLQEPNEVFDLTMSNLIGDATIGAPNPVSVRIVDPIDSSKPTFTVLTPNNNELILEPSGPVVHVTGTAEDNRGIEEVGVSLDGGPFIPAPLTHSVDFLNCTFDLPLTVAPGVHTLVIRVTDTRGNTAPTVKRTFTYRVERELFVSVNDPLGGTVSKGFEPSSMRLVGFPLTISAATKPGFVFNGWTVSDYAGTNLTPDSAELPKISFIMQPGLTLIANFIPNPFVPDLIGSFEGLVLPNATSPVGCETVGHLSALVTSKGAISGRLKIDGSNFAFRATLDNTGEARFGTSRARTLILKRKNKDDLELKLKLDMSGATARISGSVVRKSAVAVVATSLVAADRAHYSLLSKMDPTLSGGVSLRYNLILPAKEQTPAMDLNLYPQGTGYGSMILRAVGTANFAMTLADNTRFSAIAKMTRDNTCAVFAQLYGNKGCVAFILTVDPTQTETDAAGMDALWFRPEQLKSKWYPAGWPAGINMDVYGSQHLVTTGVSVIPGLGPEDTVNGNFDLNFSDGLLPAPLLKWASVNTADKLTRVPSTDTSFAAAISRTTGQLTGNILHSNNQRASWKALIFQKAGSHAGAWGFFLSPSIVSANGLGESGQVLLQAK